MNINKNKHKIQVIFLALSLTLSACSSSPGTDSGGSINGISITAPDHIDLTTGTYSTFDIMVSGASKSISLGANSNQTYSIKISRIKGLNIVTNQK